MVSALTPLKGVSKQDCPLYSNTKTKYKVLLRTQGDKAGSETLA